MFCAYRREDAASRGLTAGFGIEPGVSPPLVIETYGSADLATHNAFSLRRMQIRLSSKHSKLRRHHLPYAPIAAYVVCQKIKKQSPGNHAESSVLGSIPAATYSPTDTLCSTIGEGLA